MEVLGVRFLVKGPPQAARRSFAIYKDTRVLNPPPDFKRYERLSLPTIESINSQLKDGKIDETEAVRSVQKIKEELENAEKRKQPKKTYAHYNMRLIDSFIEQNVRKRKRLNDKRGEELKVQMALCALGDKNFRVISNDELQAIADGFKAEGTHKHMVRIYNRLAAFIERTDIKIQITKKTKKNPPYLTHEQVKRLVSAIPADELESFPLLGEVITLTFNLGTRIGETLALDRSSLKQHKGKLVVRVDKQLKQDLSITKPKSVKRDVKPLFPDETFDALKKWAKADLSKEERHRYRAKSTTTVRTLAMSLFRVFADEEIDLMALDSVDDLPSVAINEDVKFKGIHMLRSSHVKQILAMGGSLTDAASQLGDHIFTVQTYYSGYVHSEETLDRLDRILTQYHESR